MPKKKFFEVAIWYNGGDDAKFFERFLKSVGYALDTNLDVSAMVGGVATMMEVAKERIERLPLAQPKGKKLGKVSVVLKNTTAYKTFNVFTPAGEFSFVLNHLLNSSKPDERCYVHLRPTRGSQSVIMRASDSLGVPKELYEKHTGAGVRDALVR